MNERIKELVKQAGGHFSTHTLTSYPAQHRESIQLWDKNIEKFAQLIVRDCIDVFSKDLPDTTIPDYQLGSLPEVVNRIANVAEHFGVEE